MQVAMLPKQEMFLHWLKTCWALDSQKASILGVDRLGCRKEYQQVGDVLSQVVEGLVG